MHVPGWHDLTIGLQREGKLQMLGIIQEQNPDRCRLFMQWKEMEWPILVDTFDQLEVSVVPLTYAIDEHGIVRRAGLRLRDADTIEETFVDTTWPSPASDGDRAQPEEESWQRAARLATSGRPRDVEKAVSSFRQLVERSPDDGWAHFRFAAALRLRYDSGARSPGDFQRAVDHWQRALEIDPNNYIWRRRIQQYGPRLIKPYPFYDWIAEARREIVARGEVPSPLVVEPSGAEIAQPAEQLAATGATGATVEGREPDPRARVLQDGEGTSGRLIDIETTAVPKVIEPGESLRAHVVLRPNDDLLAHWNNETEPLTLWIDVPAKWTISSRLSSTANADAAVSTETRSVEVEIESPDEAAPGRVSFPGYALYYVCEDENGTCLYRRQDFEIDAEIASR